jgi:undecaprenyl diphosphate synthase
VKTNEFFKPANHEEADLLDKLDPKRLPDHLAIIMDGNGRWAQKRHLPRIAGHRTGVKTSRTIIETCSRLHLPCLTLYAFSVENWRRPQTEVKFLMSLLREYLKRELVTMQENNIQLMFIGRSDHLPAQVQDDMNEGVRQTAKNTGMKLVLAIDYGARAELVDAFNSLLSEANGNKSLVVDEEAISRHLYTSGLPDPDLLIRTSGEMRVSNFLLWQIAYAEIYVTQVLWPDFSRACLLEALIDYQRRERRYGGLGGSRARTAGASDQSSGQQQQVDR